jgi:hypothetical protein
MTAGQSAYDVARRQREKADRLQRSAALWEQGAAGEVKVARALEALPAEWTVLHDLAWPGRPRANIDHVVIGPSGVFVVDAKNWTGTVEVRDHVLRQNGYQREKAVSSASEAALALQPLLPGSRPVTSVLCFVGDQALSGRARDVVVCSSSTLVATLTAHPVVMDLSEVDRCADVVRGLSARKATPRTRAASSRKKRGRLPIAQAAVALVFLALLTTGGLTKVTGWFGDQMVEVITETEAPAQTPAPQDVRKKKRVKKDATGSRSSG